MFLQLRRRLAAGLPRNTGRDLRFWTRAIYITLPLLLVFNYLIIFHWSYFDSFYHRVFPDHTFHPAPVPPLAHTHESHDAPELDYWTWNTTTRFESPRLNLTSANTPCAVFPRYLLKKIQVVLKVGAADHWSRTDAQLSSVIKCISNVLVASDRLHTYGPKLEAHDVLAPLPPESYMHEDDYAVYASQKNASVKDLRQGHEGWKIDKYKFLPQVEQAVQANADAEWFVFLESDTYIFWDNVFRLLENYDHTHPYYFGSPSPGRVYPDTDGQKNWFAYGGAGFVLSNAAAHRLVDRKRNSLGLKGPRVTDEYREDVLHDCCGDSVLGYALHDKAGVDISGLWPMFNPHPLAGVPFGKWYWCEPVISLHKTAPEDFLKLWQWENKRDRRTGPLLYRDLATYHHLDTFTQRQNWDAADFDGFTEPDNSPAHTSLAACSAACTANAACFQYTWHGQHCYMARSMRLGHSKAPDGVHDEVDRAYVSGWDVVKIERWRREHMCAEGPHWVKPSVKRIF
ncbi:hypothetical protein BDV95DRAFT_487700 [Massariosphaeria phaeospora]|uniref:N-acetylgalactosaminide beta-1,3-galactosyltransferase n=1 Tax=Massariosphaeria phaeospora TaxID=100035 RepID=A0A7C8MDZ2_9PLEO|nr:hypothetical protein BDV95DRAFT_487700 [Massariosphaeria phaeospora]